MVGFVGVPARGRAAGAADVRQERRARRRDGPVRRYLPELLDLVTSGRIDPGKVFDATMPLEEVAEGYRAMDERRAIKVLIEP